MRCPNCGAKFPQNANICIHCGTMMSQLVTASNKAVIKAKNELGSMMEDKYIELIEDGKTDRISKMFKDYADKIYMMKNMLKDYGRF